MNSGDQQHLHPDVFGEGRERKSDLKHNRKKILNISSRRKSQKKYFESSELRTRRIVPLDDLTSLSVTETQTQRGARTYGHAPSLARLERHHLRGLA
ncbi:hypothetical protein EYF80_033581 [Liparis tanakae]|uniref:Uncharacterized protein n=1 Tax=Liparis tanakae TaxID=230148 RepID=A0A4Z2GSW8_9TELE|nr:hypothetical protein EYF80_033581 [Liparis tanakae]